MPATMTSPTTPFLPTELPCLTLRDPERQRKVEELLAPLQLSEEQQQRVRDVFLEEMRLGLAASPERPSSLLMENTFIPELVDGTENGEYLALDLGGTNFRVLWITLKDGTIVEEVVDCFHVPDETRLGPGEQLFDFLAKCLAEFIHKKNISGRHFELGFTFSFPMRQRSLDVGLLDSWTKSFNCSGVLGKDVVLMLNEAIQRRGDIHITVNAILNDTTGTIVMGAYLDSLCALGIILGTGSNGCYIEKVDRIEKWIGKHPEEEMIVDIEWGAFGDNGVLDFIKTEWDSKVDEQSLLVNTYTFEKYFAGKYMGDLLREVLLTLAKEGILCDGNTGRLDQHGAITTTSVSHIERESFEGGTGEVRRVLGDLGLPCEDEDVDLVRHAAALVSYRGVLLVSLLSGLLLERMKRPHCTIAIDGSLFRHHPRFKPLMEHFLRKFAPSRSFDLRLALDGSGKGAALVAAIAERLRRKSSASSQ